MPLACVMGNMDLVRPLGIKEIVRSGKTALARSVQHETNNHRHAKE